MPVGDIPITAVAQIATVYPAQAEVITLIAASTITAGMPLYITSAGKVAAADANAGGLQQFRGIALNAASAMDPVSVLKKGHVYGFDVSGVAYDALLYVSDTVGRIADGVGTLTVNIGRVVALPNPALTKVVYVEADWLRVWV